VRAAQRVATQARQAVTPARAAALGALGAAGAVAAGAAATARPQPQPQPPQARLIVEVRGPSEAERRFWESYYRTQQLQQQREATLRAIREQATQWQRQYESHRAAQERAWAEYQRVLAQTGSPQAAIAAHRAVMASAPPPPPPQPTSFVAGRAGVSPQPQSTQSPQTQTQAQPSQQQSAPTWAAIARRLVPLVPTTTSLVFTFIGTHV